MNFFLKLICRFPVETEEVNLAYPNLNAGLCRSIAVELNASPARSHIELFREFTRLLDNAGIDHPEAESMQHYLKERINEMTQLMNSKTIQRSNYRKDTFLILAEKYFSLKEGGTLFRFLALSGYIITRAVLFHNL